MSKTGRKSFSFENDLNFENLSNLLNELGIASHPLTNEQKVCIEYPNIFSESKNLDIIDDNLKKLETEPDKEKENKSKNSEMTLNISKNKTYTINVEKLFEKMKNKCTYTQEILTNSLKIFVSIFNNFNEDIFKWNLEDIDLFNSSNKIQFFIIENIIKNNFNMNEQIENLYNEHIESYSNKNSNNLAKNKNVNLEITQNDDFADDFDDSKVQNNKNANNDDSFGNNLFIIGDNQNEDDIIFRNIYFLINIFNLMNCFYLNDFNIDNLMRNISLFNSYIINDPKILLLIHFNLCIQINLTLSKQTIDNFLGISNTNNTSTTTTISSAMGPIVGKTINFFYGGNEKNSSNNKGNNKYIPSIFFIDFHFLENGNGTTNESNKNNNNINSDENNKEKIILFNFIIKSFVWTYFIRHKICLKIYIKIFNISYFSYMKKNMQINQNIRQSEKIYELIKNSNYVNLLNDNLLKEYILLINADFKFISELRFSKIEEYFKIYFPIFLNCNMISFEIININETCILYDFVEELNMIIWLLKFYLKIRKYKFKKYTFTFSSNSFSLAIKKNKISKIEESYTKEITLFMGINQYKPIEFIKHLSDINNFNGMYKLYKSIIKSFNDYQNYDIGIRLFKDNINNKELRYYIAMLILKLENYINSNKDIYKKLVLYENKLINPLNCVYLNIKKKLLKIKNKQNNNTKNENDLNVNFKLKEKNEGGVLSKIDIFSKLKKNTKDSNADRNDVNINNFYKSLGELGLNHDEKMSIYNFVKEVKYYFTEFILFSSKNIIFKNKDESFDPLNIIQHYANNKCFIIINDMTFIDLYIYLTDSFEINILTKEEENKNNPNNTYIFFNAIISNIKVLKFVCKENFESNHGHIQLRNVNIILNKTTFLKNELFQDYKTLFNENNIVYILDENTKTNCIFGDTHITIVSDIDENNLEENNNKYLYEDYFTAFYNMFINTYDIIKFLNDKKLRKYNKLDLIHNKKILQIKDGKIQIKKIYKEEENNNNNNSGVNKLNISKEIKNENKEEKEEKDNNININNININNINNDNDDIIKKEEIIEKEDDKEVEIEIEEEKEDDDNINSNNNKLNILNNNNEENKDKYNNKIKKMNYTKHNILKIKELFQYQNSFPLISLMLIKETEISNLSFLFYIFEEIFLSKKNQNETKEALTRKIIRFLNRFKSSKFIPIIFNEKYFYKFLLFFAKIINKKESKEEIKSQFFENVVFFPLEADNIDNTIEQIKKKLNEEKNILINLIKNIHIFKLNTSKYTKNEIGKLFKYNRIINTMKDFGTKCKNVIKDNENVLIYEISDELLDEVYKKNKKKVKLVEDDKNNNNGEDLKNNNIEKECIIF